MRMQGYCDVYKWTILKRTSPEVKCLHPTSSRREMCTLSVSNVIYHKFSHGAAFYTLNGKNVNVMLELTLLDQIPLLGILCIQRRSCSDAAERGVRSGSTLFIYMNFYAEYNKNQEPLNLEMDSSK